MSLRAGARVILAREEIRVGANLPRSLRAGARVILAREETRVETRVGARVMPARVTTKAGERVTPAREEIKVEIRVGARVTLAKVTTRVVERVKTRVGERARTRVQARAKTKAGERVMTEVGASQRKSQGKKARADGRIEGTREAAVGVAAIIRAGTKVAMIGRTSSVAMTKEVMTIRVGRSRAMTTGGTRIPPVGDQIATHWLYHQRAVAGRHTNIPMRHELSVFFNVFFGALDFTA